MLVISAGMPKSGSAYMYNIINDLMVVSGNADARSVKLKHGLEGILKWHNNNLSDFRIAHLVRLIWLARAEGSFSVKSHSGPTWALRFLTKIGLIRVIYVYRDPRDVLVSAIDHGKKLLAAGESHTFASMVDFDKALANVRNWLEIWKEYSKIRGILRVRYEDLLVNSSGIIEEVIAYLGLRVNPLDVERILWRYSKENHEANMTGLHFNKATIGRYKEQLTISQRRMIDEALGTQIAKMGYEMSDSVLFTGEQHGM